VRVKVNLGSLLRRLHELADYHQNSYAHYAVIVVSADDQYADIIKEQGFWFIRYKPEAEPEA
ncbi:MAG: hypothetical protein GY796_02900, partial [Chloroflexi bacterium]|nr:hypothetical protein [Chloroflexota bacterium]